MKCSKIRKLLSSYLDKELKEKKSERIKKHLSRCPTCSKELEAFKNLHSLFTLAERKEPRLDLWPLIHSRLMEEAEQVRRKVRPGISLKWIRRALTPAFSKGLVILLVVSLIYVLPALPSIRKSTPDSLFYLVKRISEEVNLTVAFSSERKVILLVDLAQQRITEAQTVIENDKPEYLEKLMNAYQEHIVKIREYIDKVLQEDKNLNQAQETIKGADKSIAKQIENLQELMENLSPQAKEILQSVISDTQRERIEITQLLENRERR